MKGTVLPSAYFPPTSWMTVAIAFHEDVNLDIHEHYVKQTCRNRCTIISANGLMDLIVPVLKYRNHTAVKEIRVDYSTNWQRVHEHAIRSAYGKSAYFEHYADIILPLYTAKPDLLIEWNHASLNAIQKILKTKIDFRISSEYIENDDLFDLREGVDFKPERLPTPKYMQVFMERHGFYSDLSVLDVLFCCGPQSIEILLPNV
jgi:hypothetical protein